MAPASPSTSPRGIAGCATERASTRVSARASALDSSAATRALRIEVATESAMNNRTASVRYCATGLRSSLTRSA